MKQRPKEFADRDLINESLFPVITWSSVNAFVNYDKDKWYENYVLGKRGLTNPAMEAGIEIGERWASDSTFLPEVERPEIFEQNLTSVIDGITIRGHIDGLHLTKKKKLQELKTTVSKTKWNKDSVREWGQITFYCLLLYIHYKIRPEDLEIELIYVPCAENGDFEIKQSGPPVIIPTERTMNDILKFGVYLKNIHKKMRLYIKGRELSTPNLTTK